MVILVDEAKVHVVPGWSANQEDMTIPKLVIAGMLEQGAIIMLIAAKEMLALGTTTILITEASAHQRLSINCT